MYTRYKMWMWEFYNDYGCVLSFGPWPTYIISKALSRYIKELHKDWRVRDNQVDTHRKNYNLKKRKINIARILHFLQSLSGGLLIIVSMENSFWLEEQDRVQNQTDWKATEWSPRTKQSRDSNF